MFLKSLYYHIYLCEIILPRNVNVREKIQLFKNFFRGLKIMVELLKKSSTFLCKKQNKSILKNCLFHRDLLLELFKTANFSKNLNLRIFRFFSFSNISRIAWNISQIQVLSWQCSKLNDVRNINIGWKIKNVIKYKI